MLKCTPSVVHVRFLSSYNSAVTIEIWFHAGTVPETHSTIGGLFQKIAICNSQAVIYKLQSFAICIRVRLGTHISLPTRPEADAVNIMISIYMCLGVTMKNATHKEVLWFKSTKLAILCVVYVNNIQWVDKWKENSKNKRQGTTAAQSAAGRWRCWYDCCLTKVNAAHRTT